MDLKTLKAKHPEAYQAAVAEGEKNEFDRVSAHLMCGQNFGAMPRALQAIRDRELMTAEVQNEYISAATNRLEQRARQLDSDEAGEVLAGAKQVSQDPLDAGDQVAAAMGLTMPPRAPMAAPTAAPRPTKGAASPDNGDKVAAAMGLATGQSW